MKRFLAAGSVVAVLAACTPAAAPTSPEAAGSATVIRLGYIGPLTGDAASYGKDTLNGVRMAIAELNAAEGGPKFELVAEDGRCNGTDAASAAQKLVTINKVAAIVGGQCSGETLAAAPIAESNKIVLISPISTSPDVTTAGEFVFRVSPSDALKAKATAAVFAENGYVKVAMLTENTDYAVGLQKALRGEVGEENVVFDELVPAGSKDVRSLVSRLKNLEFDVLFLNGQSDAVIAAMAQQIREQGIEQPFFSQDVADSVTLGELAAEAVEGLQLINTSSKLGDGGEGSFGARFRAQYGEPQANLSFATLAHDATMVVAAALADGKTGDALKDALLDLDSFTGAAGTFHFDDNGDVTGIGYALKEFKDGKIVELKDIAAE